MVSAAGSRRVPASLLLALAAGCGGGGALPVVAARSDVVEFYAVNPEGRRELKPEPPAPLLRPMAPSPSGWHMGVRASLVRQMDMGGARTSEQDAQTASLWLRRAGGSGRGAAFELSLGYSLIQEGDLEPFGRRMGITSTDFFIVRMDLLMQFGGRGFAPYLALGAAVYAREGAEEALDSGVRLAAGEAAFGLGSPGGRWDLRFTYSFVSDGDDLENLAELSLGIGF